MRGECNIASNAPSLVSSDLGAHAALILSNHELLQRARLLPPQIAQVSMLLRPVFDGVFTDDEMIQKIKSL